jgi:hypothetical protein
VNILYIFGSLGVIILGLIGKIWFKNRKISKLETKVEQEEDRADIAEAKGEADHQVDVKAAEGQTAAAERMADPTVKGKKGKDKIKAIDIATRKKKGLPTMLFFFVVLLAISCQHPPPKTIVVKPKSCLTGLGPRAGAAAEPCDDEWADYYERSQAWEDAVEIACS